MWATYKGHLEVVRVLLSHGADPNKLALVVRQYKQDKPYRGGTNDLNTLISR